MKYTKSKLCINLVFYHNPPQCFITALIQYLVYTTNKTQHSSAENYSP